MSFIRSGRGKRLVAALTGALLLLTTPVVAAEAASAEAASGATPAAISGIVFSQFDPMPGIRVTVLDARSGRVLASQLASDGGEYTIEGLPPVPVKLVSTKRGYWPSWAAYQYDWAHASVIELHPGEHLVGSGENFERLYMDVMPFSSLSGTVTGQGAPLARAVVTLYDAATGRPVRATLSDEQGRFRLAPLRMGEYTVGAAKPGWDPDQRSDPFWIYPGDDSHVQLNLTQAVKAPSEAHTRGR
jgi:carboxypeptidase family protein